MTPADFGFWHELTVVGTAAIPSASGGTSAVPMRSLAGKLLTHFPRRRHEAIAVQHKVPLAACDEGAELVSWPTEVIDEAARVHCSP